jgi:ribonuclease BN (tRNA processing enzyme)
MLARIWGARGSLPAPGLGTARHGGNTSCVEVELDDGTLLVLDAGTGIRGLGERLAVEGPREIHICLTHLHLDHLEGLPFFAPLWQDGAELHVWGPPSPITSLAHRVARYLSPPLFPRSLSDVRARLWFHDTPEGQWELGSGRCVSAAVVHPGPTVGYRVEENGRSMVYLPDHEPALAAELDGPTEWLSGFDLAGGADVLLHDAQYFPEQYVDRIGWGHSTVEHAVAFARAAAVGRLVLFHHDPSHSEQELLRLQVDARRLWGDEGTPPELAREGMEINP